LLLNDVPADTSFQYKYTQLGTKVKFVCDNRYNKKATTFVTTKHEMGLKLQT